MTDKERSPLDYARDVVGRDPLARHPGIEVLEVREAYARVALTVRPAHLNALGRAPGLGCLRLSARRPGLRVL